MKRFLQRAAAAWDIAEQAALGILVLGMVTIAATQIILRNFFETGFRWADPLLGTSVLWITVLGALAATGAVKHIKIDLVSHFLPRRLKLLATALTNLFGAVACGFLVYSAARYVGFQKEMGDNVLPNLPVWVAYMILPIGFLLIAVRFLLDALLAAIRAFSAHPPDPEPALPGEEA
ncbi:MAG: TRAP transporter small permease subunit [Lentisphaerae bacterium]|nr:TRAP transporter small permease subunit [Lentisphaerota bacterium]